MHSDRVESRGRSIRSIMIYLCIFCVYSSSSFPCFSLGRNPRGCRSMILILNAFFGGAAMLKPLIGQLDLLTCLCFCMFTCGNQRFNECRVRCSTRGTTTSQTMRHLLYHLSSFCMFGITMSGGTVRATKRTSYLWRIFKRRRQGYIPYWMPKQL